MRELNNKHDDFGFERGFEVMRYVPLSERETRSQPPPPPPSLITQLRNRRNTLRRRRRIRQVQSTDFSESDSDDISDLDIVETIVPPSQEMNTISVTIPPPPPVVSVSVRRPTNPPPPPPVSNNLNPFVATRQLPRTPVRNSQNIDTRENISNLGNILGLGRRSVNNNF